MSKTRHNVLLWAAIALLTEGLAGCTQINAISALRPFGIGKPRCVEATPENPAIEILALWQPAEGAGENGLPTRGFAGQIFFFTRASDAPVKVNGEVRIYEFDDAGTAEEQKKPLRQFVFEPDVWNLHLHESLLGPAYQVFIPYVRSDPHRVNCTLSMKFTAPTRQPLYSKMVSVSLPGPARAVKEDSMGVEQKEIAVRSAADNRVQEAFSSFLNKGAGPSKVEALLGEAASAGAKGASAKRPLTIDHQVIQAAVVEAERENSASTESRVQQAEAELTQLLAHHSAQRKTDPEKNTDKQLSTPRAAQGFRLGKTENGAAALLEDSASHPLIEESGPSGSRPEGQSTKIANSVDGLSTQAVVLGEAHGRLHPLEADGDTLRQPGARKAAESGTSAQSQPKEEANSSFNWESDTTTNETSPSVDSDPWQAN